MLDISVHNNRQQTHLEHTTGPLELGRGPARSVPRCVIEDVCVSRDQLLIEELPGGRVRLTNLSSKIPVQPAVGPLLPASGSADFELPLRLTVGETVLDIHLAGQPRPTPKEIPATQRREAQAPTLTPAPDRVLDLIDAEDLEASGYLSIQPVRGSVALRAPSPLGEAPSPETLTQWMEMVLALQRSGSGPPGLYHETARALVAMTGLDVGLVLLHGTNGWQVVARAAQNEGTEYLSGREFSQTVLREVLTQKQTFYQDLGRLQNLESLRNVDAVVVSPIFGLNDEVVGALYGLRHSHGRLEGQRIRPLEAQLVQLLAAAAGANLARTAATATRTRFEQFFSPELVRELERNPGLLAGQSQEVTILMSDLRGFSTFSERLGPETTCRLVRDVMERLSERVVEQGGVIVSYLGDGLLAMWNAPASQPDHAVRACRAALAMLAELPELNATWQSVVGQPLRLGIGINTGLAQVGNTGSSRKFMYGPLGNTVNLASRVEGATKYLQVPVLISGSTRAQLGDQFATRRLGQVRVLGIQEPINLHELYGESATAEWLAYRDTYEAALALYEEKQWLLACQRLLPLLERTRSDGGYDHASLKLMKRAWSCLESPPDSFDPVLELTGK